MKKTLVATSVFICGACVMALELAGMKIFAPYFGTSLFVYSAVIGIILGSMSYGYGLGGKLADKNPTYKVYSLLIALSSILVALVGVLKNPILTWISFIKLGASLGSITASIILLAIPAVFLATVSPYAIKLILDDMGTVGAISGRLSALSTGGSIFGTFLTSFVLIPSFGTTKIVVIISCVLFAVALLFISRESWKLMSIAAVVILICSIISLTSRPGIPGLIDQRDTKYSTISVIDEGDMRTMLINNEHSSAIFLSNDKLAHKYLEFYDLAFHFNPGLKSALCIGGAGYSYPSYYIKKYPECTMDVVEIDEGATTLAREYFGLTDNPRLGIIHQDGRVFLNNNTKKYDAVLGDAFNSHSPPAQLVTLEATKLAYDSLNDNGIYLINVIGSLDYTYGAIGNAMYGTMQAVFPQVYMFPVHAPHDESVAQNLIIVGIKSTDIPSFENEDEHINAMLGNLVEYKSSIPIMTDDYAPVDFYTAPYTTAL